jgi:hypothetical protein
VRSTGISTEGGGGGWLPPKKGELGWLQALRVRVQTRAERRWDNFIAVDVYAGEGKKTTCNLRHIC